MNADASHEIEVVRPLAMRLRAAREARGLTQAQASVELGVSRPLLIAIEKGTREASPHEIAKLADTYRVPVSELLRPTPPPASIATRLSASIPTAQRNAAELIAAIAALQHHADDYLDLLRRTDAHPPGRPEPISALGSADPHRAEDLATEERNRLSLGDGPIQSLREVLEFEVGLRIFLLPLPPSIVGLFVIVDRLGACTTVNSKHPAERQRWTLAHEYAHYLTNRDRAEVTQLAHLRQPEYEQFADAFAANFLMPRSGLSRRFYELKRTRSDRVTPAMLASLARLYGVSIQSLSNRLEALGLLRMRTWESQLEQSFRQRTAERIFGAGDAGQPADALPMHFRMLAIQLFADGEITESQFAHYLHTDIIGARRAYSELTETADVGNDGSPQIFDLAEVVG